MSARPDNTNYKVQIRGPGKSVIGWTPEQFNLRIQSDWEPLLANMLSSLGKGAIGDLAAMGGYVPFVQAITGQVWRHSEPIEFQLDLQFDAEDNPDRDVTVPVKTLIEWSMPFDTGYGFLHAPGPTILNHTPMFDVRIGNYLFIPDVIFPALDVTWYTAPHRSGHYVAADVSLTVKTFYTPTRQDVLNWFVASPPI